ncbi:MAG: hypothetical protein ABI685_00855 [Ferruginibacter sp.]
MYKFLLLLCLSFTASGAWAQTDSLSKEDKRMLDSMFNNDEFIKLMTKTDKSYLDVNIGIGNGIFSLKNNALNAGQAQTNKIYYTPAVGYYHKSGMAITVTGFLAADDGGLKMYQYGISPSYTYSNKKFATGISYTRFIEGSTASFNVSPFKNDFYASALYKKTWIQPGIALGFSFGKQVDYYDTAFWLLNRVVQVRDTITTRLSGLSLTLSATHKWNYYELLGKKDAIQLQPSLMLNAGSQKWNTTHSSRLFSNFPRLANYLKKRYGSGSGADKFKLQSLAFLGELTYYYGKFYLQPQIYLDYYLPTTTEKRLTSLFSVTAGISFY